MKKIIVAIVVLSFWVGTSMCLAETGIPDMLGIWLVKTEGGVIDKSGIPSAKTHHSGDFSTLNAEISVTKQQGRVFRGTLVSPKAREDVVGVIGMDNKSIFIADEDGFAEGKIVSKNKITVIYRHATPSNTVVAVGTLTRKK